MIDLSEAEEKIDYQKRNQGPYWNNVVSSVLREVASDHGKEAANRLIKRCNLKNLGWEEEV